MNRAIRKVVFWLHLVAGIGAGAVVLLLAVTGVIMSFERQILESTTGITLTTSGPVLGPEAILSEQAAADPAVTAVVFHKDAGKPAVVQFGKGKSIFVDPHTGESLGEGNPGTKKFFAWVLTLHRWLAQEGAMKDVGKGIIGVGNLVFLFLVISGLWLWFPRRWTRSGIKAITTLRFRLKGRARDWNWHNAFGFWACVPLFVIVTTGAVMSYPWASNLIFLAVGETPPAPKERGGPQGGREAMNRGGERPSEGGGRRERGQRGGGGEHSHDHAPVSFSGLDGGFAAAKAANPDWQTIQVSMPRGETAQITVSESHRGRPDLRRTLTVDLATAAVVKNEGMESQSTGRKIRTFVRWVHTGEALGWVGQLMVALSTLAAIVLVWTGFALSWRRFFKKRALNAAVKSELKEAA